jgi:tight adherence protein B
MLAVAVTSWALLAVILGPATLRWLAMTLRRLEERLLRRLEDLHIYLQGRAIRVLVLGIVGVGIVVAMAVFDRLVFLPIIVGAMAFGGLALIQIRLKKRLKDIRYQLPDVIELIATSLRAGSSIRAALLQVARQSPRPISQELAVLERMQRIGVPLDSAFDQWSKRLGIEEVGLLAFTVSVSSASGGNLSDALDRLAAAFRQRLMLEEKVDALTAQGRLQAWVMIALPLLLAIVLSLMDFESMAPLWRSNTGLLVLVAVATLEVSGFVWIRRLIRMED